MAGKGTHYLIGEVLDWLRQRPLDNLDMKVSRTHAKRDNGAIPGLLGATMAVR